MAKLSSVLLGAKARKIVDVCCVDGATLKCALVPLDGEDEADAFAGAEDFAKAKGVTEPKPGHPIYERGLWAHTILRAALDPDSSAEKPERFFDGGAEQIRQRLDGDEIALLFERQREWQREVSPRPERGMSGIDFVRMTIAITDTPEGAELPLEFMPRATQRTYVRALAVAFTRLPLLNSQPGSTSPVEPPTSKSSASRSPAGTPPATQLQEPPNSPEPSPRLGSDDGSE